MRKLWHKIRKWEPIYWLRTHTVHRYHIVDMSNTDGYKWGWLDRSHAIFIACFKLLDEFVVGELDNPKNIQIDWSYDEGHRHAIREIRSLHFWWRHQREAEIRERNALFDRLWKDTERKRGDPFDDANNPETGINPFFDELHRHELRCELDNLNDFLDRRDQRQLERLIRIREYLWT